MKRGSWYLELLGSIVVCVNPLGHAPVFQGDAFQEVKIHVKADTEREEREIWAHDTLYVLLDGAELYLSYIGWSEKKEGVKYKHVEKAYWCL